MAEHDVTGELFYGGVWNDVTTDLLVKESLTTSRGLADNLEPIPGDIRGALLNTGGKYNPANPASVLYDSIGLNTPFRLTVDGDVQTGEMAEWRPSRPLAGTSRAGFTAAGVLRRLGQGETPLRPALARVLDATPPAAWWPLDDPAGAPSARSAIAGIGPLSFDDAVRPGVVDADEQLGGGKRPQFFAGGTVFSGVMTSPGLGSATTAGGFVLDMWVYVGSGELTADTGYLYFTGSTLTSGRFRLLSIFGAPDDPIGFNFDLRSSASTVSVFAFIPKNQWVGVRMVAYQSGGNINMEFHTTEGASDTDTMAGQTLGRLDVVQLGAYDDDATNTVETLAYSDVVVWDTLTPPDTLAASNGWIGETAADRFERLCEEEGIPAVVVGTAADSQPMGAQPPDTLTEILMECVRTDAAMMYATRDEVGLTFRCGRSLYGQDPALTLSMTAEQVAPPVDPIVGDQLVRNDVTAKSSSTGAQARVVVEDGPLSVQAPPDGVGRYDTQWNVNPADDGTLEAHAGWHANRGTYAGIRYRTVTVDMDAAGVDGALTAAVAALDIGDAVLLTDIDPEDTPDDFVGLVIRIEQAIRPDRRMVTLVLVPAGPYEAGIVGTSAGSVDVRGQRINSGVAVLAAGVTASATAWSVSTAGGVRLTTTAAAWNTGLNGGGMFLRVGGEVVRVTSITGASSPQTVNVVRSVNGVSKAHTAGTRVQVRDGIRVAL